MNRIYHLVFNRALGLLQVAPETARAHKKSVTASRLVGAVFSLGLLAGTGTAMAITHYINDDEFLLVNGSTWNAGSKLILVVGHTNNGTLRIENSGKVINWNVGEIGANSGSTGTATVSGAGSEWKNSDWLTVGESGTGTLHIADGGRVESDYGYIGKYLGSIGTATVSGTGSEWKNSSDLSVGDYGTGTLNIAGDGKVENKDGYIGRYNGSIGAVTVSGVNSSWVNSSDLSVGWYGTGTLNITDGGKVKSNAGIIGVKQGSIGTVTVSGSGSEWKGSNWLTVGDYGTGTLNIADGGRVESAYGYISFEPGSIGTVTISGTNSVWSSSVSVRIGNLSASTGVLNIGAGMDNNGSPLDAEPAGRLETVQLAFGAGSGTLNFNHTDNYTFDTPLHSSGNGTHKLNHWAGTTILTRDNSGFSGTTTMEGGTLRAGANNAFANNTAYIINGGTLDLNNHDLTMSSLSGSGGSVKLGTAALTVDQASDTTYAGNITGSGSGSLIKKGGGTLALTGSVASFDTIIDNGALNIVGGGSVTSSSRGRIGDTAGSTGTVTVSGANSSWTNSSDLRVGALGEGILNIENGGSVSNGGYGEIGVNPGSTGTVRVSGAGSEWKGSAWLLVGGYGTGTLHIIDGGRVESAYGYIGDSAGSIGTVTISGANSVWSSSAAVSIGTKGTGILNIGAGMDSNGNPLAAEPAGRLETGWLTFNDGGGTLNFNHTDDNYIFDTRLDSGNGTHKLNHWAGTTILTGDNSSFSGTATVEGGVLLVNGSNKSSTHIVKSSATLGGSGTVGNTSINDGGTLAGVQGQTLTINGNLSLANNSSVEVELGGASVTPLFDVTNDLTLGGTLNVTDQGGFGSGLYRLFDYGGTLNNEGMVVGTAPASNNLSIQTAVAGQVNLLSTSNNSDSGDSGDSGDSTLPPKNIELSFWDGGNTALHDNDMVNGGAGIWRADGRNWTDSNGGVNGHYQPNPTFAIFQGNAGTVTVDDSAGAIAITGMQFANNGYQVNGKAIKLEGADGQTTIRVGDGTSRGANMTATIDAALTGSGSLVKKDLGTLILRGTNSYKNTLVEAGTLVGNVNVLSGNISNAATVVFDQADDASFAGHIFGLAGDAGEMVKRGDAVLRLGGNNALDWKVEAGELVSATERFTGNLQINNNATFTFDQVSDGRYNGSISGAGKLLFTGGGKVELTGNSKGYRGTTSINGTTLAVNNHLGGLFSVGQNGRLQGTGTVGSTRINDGGILAPGNSIGTLRVDGDLTFAADSAYEVEVDPSGTGSDHVYVTGTAYLNGSVAHIGLGGVDDYAANRKYRILSAEGGLSGRFNSVSSAFTFLDADLTYDTSSSLHGVDLILKRNDLKFSNKRFAGTRNQQATAMGAESLPATHRLYGSVVTHTGSDAALSAIYDKLSGEIHASVHAALVEDSRLLRLAVNERLRAAAGEAAAPMKAETNPVKQHSAADSSTTWVQAVGNWGETSGDTNAASLDRDTKGVIAGVDRQLSEQTRAGALLGYTRSTLNAGSTRGSASSDTVHLGIYAGTRLDNGPGREQGQGELALRGGLFYGYHDIETKRHVQLGALNERLEAQRAAHSLHAYAELAYRVDAGHLAVEPFANLAHVHQRSQGGSERATGSGETALRSKKQSTDTSFITLGVRPSVEVPVGNATANVYGSIGWQHALGDTTPQVDQRFSAGNTFTVAGTPIASNAAVVEAGVKLKINDRASLDLSYAGKHGSRVKDHGGRASFQWRF